MDDTADSDRDDDTIFNDTGKIINRFLCKLLHIYYIIIILIVSIYFDKFFLDERESDDNQSGVTTLFGDWSWLWKWYQF